MDLFLKLDGRIGRGQWWLGVIALIVVQWIVFAALIFIGIASVDPESAAGGSLFAQLIMFLIFLWPSICVTGKRFHDRDKSAWWMLIGLVPIVGFIWIIIDCGILKGTEGPNRFGEDPVG